jgi:hypothetical protein
LETAVLPLKLRPYSIGKGRFIRPSTSLLDFLVRLMLAALRTKLFQFETLSGCLLVLGIAIVPVLALGALERDDFAGHGFTPDFLN